MSDTDTSMVKNAPVIHPHDGSAYPGHDDNKVRPVYRGPPAGDGMRIPFARAGRLNWSHDGSNEDIVGYEVVEAMARP